MPPTGDVVEISTVAKLAAQMHTVPEVRVDLVARVRSEIEAGTYETQERIDLTVDRLMGEFFG
ncbi:MAG: flagellar biosynthesis anti-sigma factor FlgM [Planctomycetes bacterium]|nr:flagellar biosynthesis anti-sigma factor FlgM [Planctomycetota bacterium]